MSLCDSGYRPIRPVPNLSGERILERISGKLTWLSMCHLANSQGVDSSYEASYGCRPAACRIVKAAIVLSFRQPPMTAIGVIEGYRPDCERICVKSQ